MAERSRPSLRMRLLCAYLGLSPMKRTLGDVPATEAARLENRRRGVTLPAGDLLGTHEVTVDDHDGLTCVSVGPRDRRAGRTIVYVPGGGYVNHPIAAHWAFMGALATENDACVVAPLYPLAPEGTAATVVPAMVALHRRLSAEAGAPPVWAGDSAGAGLALATALWLRDQQEALPAHLVLIAPWLDVEMRHPDVAAILDRDPMQDLPGLRYAGAMWAGDLSPADPLVSPGNGELHGLPPLTVIGGTRDILHAGARDFAERASTAGVDVVLLEAPGGVHSFPVMRRPPEAAEARRLIRQRLAA